MSVLYLAGWLALDEVAGLFQTSREVSLWYVPTGLTFALLLLGGLRYAPVLLLTDVLHALVLGNPPLHWPSVLLRAGLTTAVYAGTAWVLLHRLRINPQLRVLRDVVWFVVLACLLGPIVVAVVQVAQYSAVGLLSWREWPNAVAAFAAGSATGVGMLTPALLVGSRRWPGRQAGTATGEAVRLPVGEQLGQTALLLGSVVLAYSTSQGSLDFTYLVFVPLIWVAVRGEFARAVAAVVVVNVLAVALVGRGAASQPLRLQLSLMTLTLSGLVLGALVTQRRADAQSARHAALHDPLTGLANRALLMNRLCAAVHRADRHPETTTAVLYLDLDGFKGVNDTLGHDAGDALLTEVARRLEQGVRPSDLVSRLGGDELVLLLEDADREQVDAIAERTLTALRGPFPLAGREVTISSSIGIADLPRTADARPAGARRAGPLPGQVSAAERAEQLLQSADVALQVAKQSGGDRAQHYTEPLLRQAQQRLALHAALRRAVHSRGLHVAYQPIVALPDRRVLAVEALARWRDPDHGDVPPERFIPLAESTGLIDDLGLQILEQACQDSTAWPAAYGSAPRLAVNVCPGQLLHPDFPQHVLDILARHDLPADRLELEITESAALDGDGPARETRRALTDAGIRLVVDDFGAGYSSFAALRDSPPAQLKVDRSFLERVPADRAGVAILRAILAMADNLDIDVTAEGVQTPAQLRLLTELGCTAAQGFYIARPMTAEQLHAWLRSAHVQQP